MSSGKGLLFIGTPVDAIPFFGQALALGHKLFAIDGNPESRGLAWVRRYGIDGAVVDAYDTPGIIATVKRLNWPIDGVLAVATEVGPVVSGVAAELWLPHIPAQITRLSWSKSALKARLRVAGIPVPGFADFVVKPINGRGSRGVYVLAASGTSNPFISTAAQHGPLMFEQHIPGPGVSAEAIIWEGEVVFCGLTDRYYDVSPTVESGGYAPSRWQGWAEGEACYHLTRRVVEALAIQAGTIKLDIILDENYYHRPTVIEMAIGRIGGGFNPQLLTYAYNTNVVEMMIDVYLGRRPTFKPFRKKAYHLATRYRMPDNPDKNGDRGRFHLALGQSREEVERKIQQWLTFSQAEK